MGSMYLRRTSRRPRPMRPASGGPTPAQILGALYHSHFYAADSGISTSLGKVTVWPNRGLDGTNAIQGTSSARPALNATGWSGGPSVDFDGVNDELMSVLAVPIAALARPYIWAVMKASSGADGYCVSLVDTKPLTAKWLAVKYTNSSPPLAWMCDRHLSDGSEAPQVVVSGYGVNTLVQASSGTPLTNAIVANAAGASGTKIGPMGSPLTRIQLGLIDAAVQPMAGKIAEVIVAGDEPTAAQILAVLTYLKASARNNGLGYGV